MKILLPIFLVMLLISGCSTVPLATPQNCQSPCVLKTNSDNIKATYQVQHDRLIVDLSGRTTGWVAIGFGATHYMKDAYIVMGYIDEKGKPVISNEFGDGYVSHKSVELLGGKPNIELISGDFKDGWTSIKFSIPLKLENNNYAKTFESGETMKVLVAYGPDGAKNFTTIHAFKTITSINLKDIPTTK